MYESVMDIWSLLAYQLIAIASGAATAGIAVAIGGVGGLSALARRIKVLEDSIADTDQRITREVKQRASQAGVEARAGSKTAKQIAEAHLQASQDAAGAQPARPSVVR